MSVSYKLPITIDHHHALKCLCLRPLNTVRGFVQHTAIHTDVEFLQHTSLAALLYCMDERYIPLAAASHAGKARCRGLIVSVLDSRLHTVYN